MDNGNWDNNITALCQSCGQRFPVPHEILDAIQAITGYDGLTRDQSPCLELPDEAWDDPRLLAECPLCFKSLRFNPFVVDNREPPSKSESREVLIVSAEAMKYFNNATALHAKGRFNEAIEEYNKAIRIDPNNAQAYWARGVSYDLLGEHQRAIEDYDEAIRLDPDHAQWYKTRERAYSELAKHRQNNLDHAKGSAAGRADTKSRRKNRTRWKPWK